MHRLVSSVNAVLSYDVCDVWFSVVGRGGEYQYSGRGSADVRSGYAGGSSRNYEFDDEHMTRDNRRRSVAPMYHKADVRRSIKLVDSVCQ